MDTSIDLAFKLDCSFLAILFFLLSFLLFILIYILYTVPSYSYSLHLSNSQFPVDFIQELEKKLNRFQVSDCRISIDWGLNSVLQQQQLDLSLSFSTNDRIEKRMSCCMYWSQGKKISIDWKACLSLFPESSISSVVCFLCTKEKHNESKCLSWESQSINCPVLF